jgi:uncharacterized OsmC-like protein
MTTNQTAVDPTVEEFNGVPLAKLKGTVAKLTENPALADFRFTARNQWIEGTASKSTIHEWYGAGGDQLHAEEFTASADHPTLGHGHGVTPHEFLLHALASCIVAGVVTNAANRGIEITSIDAVAKGQMDVRGILGIDKEVRNGFSKVELSVDVKGEADQADLDALIAASTRRSAVYDILTAGTEVEVGPAA